MQYGSATRVMDISELHGLQNHIYFLNTEDITGEWNFRIFQVEI